MIIAYVGTPGSGKTYEAIAKIMDNLRIGRVIFTNIDGLHDQTCREHIKVQTGLNDEELFKQLHYLDNNQIKHFWEFIADYPGSLIVVDEVHKLFSNRNWASEENKEFTEWASTHRHNFHDVLLITQDIEKVDKHARSLIEWSYFYKKVGVFGNLVTKKYRRYSYDSDDHHGEPIDSTTLTYDKSIFPCYKSYVASENSLVEMGVQTRVNILKHPIFWSVPIMLCIFGYYLSKSSFIHGDLFGTKAVAEKVYTAQTIKRVDGKLVEVDEKAVAASPIRKDKTEKKDESAPETSNELIKAAPVVLYHLSNRRVVATNTGEPVLPGGVIVVTREIVRGT